VQLGGQKRFPSGFHSFNRGIKEVNVADLNIKTCDNLWKYYHKSYIAEEGGWTPLPLGVGKGMQDSPTGLASTLGFVNLNLIGRNGEELRLMNLKAKVLSGRIFLDFPAEESKPVLDAEGNVIKPAIIDPRTGRPKWFPHYFTKNAEFRDVLTRLVHRDPRIKALAEAAIIRFKQHQQTQPAAGEDIPAELDPGDDFELMDYEDTPFGEIDNPLEVDGEGPLEDEAAGGEAVGA
jgi:hypothetical protein